MKIDENEFFREATRRICSHLDIEKAMHACIQYLGRFVPADYLFLQLYEFELGAIRTIAKATVNEGVRLDHITAIPGIAREVLESDSFPDVTMINYPEMSIAGKTMLEYHQIENASLLMLMLRTQENTLGHLILVADDKKTFNDEQSKLYQLLKEPFIIALANTLQHREVLKLKDLLADDNRFLHRELAQSSGDDVIGGNFGLKGVMEMVRQVAAHNSPVLLLGETGTGKDVIANVIHFSSARNEGPFITVNCGAIPDSLIDSELFGHEKGAFTGALSQKRGRFERAHLGTIFLDEIGELPPAAQIRLLRVLQNQEFERVGGTTPIHIDIRVVAATHRNLEEMVAKGEFRADLWFRLNVIPIPIPPLRKRKADIPALVQHFIEKKTRELKLQNLARLSPGAIDDLVEYDWPGNVRELENVLERSLILVKSGELSFEHLSPIKEDIDADPPAETGDHRPAETGDHPLKLNDMIAHHIKHVLDTTSGKIHGPGGAAELLGINASTLRGKMNKLNIPYGRETKGN
ncbi:MAG: sigma-54-dependent Fis family transcriptional regulator [Proteobacteria bacterium]|nr:sigma-54-dependent Fis family transcriptional regulator [Pseudomonadota bacterium]